MPLNPWGPTVGYHELGGSSWTVCGRDGAFKGSLLFERIPFGTARVGEVSFKEGTKDDAKRVKSTWSVTGTRQVTIHSLGRFGRCTLKFNLNATGLFIRGVAAIEPSKPTLNHAASGPICSHSNTIVRRGGRSI